MVAYTTLSASTDGRRGGGAPLTVLLAIRPWRPLALRKAAESKLTRQRRSCARARKLHAVWQSLVEEFLRRERRATSCPAPVFVER